MIQLCKIKENINKCVKYNNAWHKQNVFLQIIYRYYLGRFLLSVESNSELLSFYINTEKLAAIFHRGQEPKPVVTRLHTFYRASCQFHYLLGVLIGLIDGLIPL